MSTPGDAPFALDRRALARSFDRAGAGYEAAAWLQQRARAELLDRLQFFRLEPRCILDVGAGTCQASAPLARRYPRAQVLAIDVAPGMLAAAKVRRWRALFARVCADAYALPLPARSVDLIYSNLMLQWCDRPDRVFAELSRVLRPEGLLAFSTFGPDSLQELRASWAAADREVHVSEFPDMPQLGDALMHAGFVEPVLDAEPHCQDYPDVYSLMRELKRTGAHNAASARMRGLTGRARMRVMAGAYERLRGVRGLPATYQLIFGAAFRGHEPDRPQSAHATTTGLPGEYRVPVSKLQRRRS